MMVNLLMYHAGIYNQLFFLFLQQDLYVRWTVIVIMQEHVVLEHAHAQTSPTHLLIAVVGINILKGCFYFII